MQTGSSVKISKISKDFLSMRMACVNVTRIAVEADYLRVL